MLMAVSSRRRAAPCRCSMSMRSPRLWHTDPGFSPAASARPRDRPHRRIAALGRQLRGVERQRRHGAVARRLCHRLPAARQGARQDGAGLRAECGARLAARLCPAGAHRREQPAGAWPMRIMCWRGPRPTNCPPCAISTTLSWPRCRRQLAKAQLAAALAAYGDTPRADAAYAAALGPPPKRPPGCAISITAAICATAPGLLAFAGDNPAPQPRLTAVMDRIAELFARADRTSTQEEAWLLMAAEAAVRADRRRDDCRGRRCAAAERERAALFPARARQRRGAGDGGQSRHRPGVAHGLDHRRPQGRSAGRKQRLHGEPRDLPRRRLAGRPHQGAPDRSASSSSSRASAPMRRAPRGPWSSTCCRPGSRSRRRRRAATRAGELSLAQGSQPTPPIPRSATTATSPRSTSPTARANSRWPMSCAR